MTEEIGRKEELAQMREVVDALEGLLKSYGWVLLSKLAEEQVKMREAQILAHKPEDLAGFIAETDLRGERNGIKLFLSLPQTIRDNTYEELKHEIELDEKDSEG